MALPSRSQQKGSHGGQRGEGGGQAGQAGQAGQDARPRADPHAPRQGVVGVGVRGTSLYDGASGGWRPSRSARRRGGCRRADFSSLSNERPSTRLAESTARSNASRAGTSRSRMPIGFNARGGEAPRSTPRANMGMRSLGSATAGSSRRCRTGRGCSCTLRGRYRCPWHFVDGVGRRARLGGVGLASRSPRRRGGSRRADFSSLSSERTMGLAERTARSHASRAGTASASTSTCRASRSSSTRTTAATSRGPRSRRLPNTRAQD